MRLSVASIIYYSQIDYLYWSQLKGFFFLKKKKSTMFGNGPFVQDKDVLVPGLGNI